MADSDSNNSSFGDITDSDDFQEHLMALKVKWKAALKKNKKLLLKCPNYDKCQSKCGSVGGMQYHYERCTGNAPRFKCNQCGRTYESRTGLNYHMASSHVSDAADDVKMDGSSRPQRSTALNTMSAIHISNNPPPLKQSLTRTPPLPHKLPPLRTTPPDTPSPVKDIREHPSPRQPKQITILSLPDEEDDPPLPTKPLVKKAGSPKVSPNNEVTAGDSKAKKATKYVTIPSIEYPDEYKSYLPVWRQEMKENKIIKCPNFKDCDFKCTTVNGMKYHFVRCKKANPPEFNCELCGKKFQCRTGLVWHLKKTHKLIDIQPSKGGGFKGTLPAKLAIHQVTPEFSVPRKKPKLEGGRENRSPVRQRPRRSFSKRKRFTPHKTPEEILQNVVMITALPSPKLGPRAIKVLIPLCEYQIDEDVPTDEAHVPRTVIYLGEEALTWQRMSSDSESEGEYHPELVYDEDTFGGYRSSNSMSDSDDDYMYGASKKKVKPKSNGGGVGGRSGPARRGRPPLKAQEIKDETYEPIPLESLSTFGSDRLPPPLITKEEKEPIIPKMPALIKTPEDPPLEPFRGSFYDTKPPTHVQPPPGLIMPAKTKPEYPKRHSTKLPEPPPLLKNSDASDLPEVYPHIVLPPNTTASQSWSNVQPSTYTHPPTPSMIAPAPTPPLKRGPGRPPKNKNKDQSGNKSARGSTTTHYRQSKGTRGHSSSYSVKGMKMTRYEFQSSSASSDSSIHTITNSTSSQPSIVSYGSQSSLPNLTPVQIISSAPGQLQTYQTVQPSGMVLMQGASPLNLDYTPSFITQDGQTYQIVEKQSPHLLVSDGNDNSQKVSVIMHPAAAYTTKTGLGGIPQLDGPPPLPKQETAAKANLKAKFEEARQHEQTKLGTNSKTVSKDVASKKTGNVTSPPWTAFSSKSAEASSEGKMSEQLKMYLEKEVARKPKQTSEPKAVSRTTQKTPKSRKSKSSSADPMSPGTDKSLRSRLTISPNLFSCPSSHILGSGTESRNETKFQSPSGSRSRSKTPRKTTPNLSDLFQPDNAPHADRTFTQDAYTQELNMELNSNYSNSNDAEDDSGTAGSSSKSRGRKRKAQGSSKRKSNARDKGKKLEGNKSVEGEDSLQLSSEDQEVPSPKKKATSLHKGEGSVDEHVASEGRKAKLGKRKRQEEEPCVGEEDPAMTSSVALQYPSLDSPMDTEQYSSECPLPGQEESQETAPQWESPTASTQSKRRRGGKVSGASPSLVGSAKAHSNSSTKSRGRGRRPANAGGQFKCDMCDGVYSSKKGLQSHTSTTHAPEQLGAQTPIKDCVPVWRKALKTSKAVTCAKCGTYRGASIEAIKYHWARCGMQESSFVVKCPHCDKEYKSDAGLKYHLRYVHVTPSPESSKSPSPALPDPTQPLPPRRAAARANKKLSDLVTDHTEHTDSAPTPMPTRETFTPSPSPSGKDEGPVVITAEIKQAFSRKESVECPHEGCTKTFGTLPGLKYHLKNHTPLTKYRCPVCSSVLVAMKRFQNHMTNKHPNVTVDFQNLIDHEYVPNEEGEDSDGGPEDWEAEKEDEDSPRSSKKKSSHKVLQLVQWIHGAPVSYKDYRAKVQEVWSELYGGREVLAGEEWQVKGHHWKRVAKSDLQTYLPECQNSLQFSVQSEGSEDTPTQTLPLFGTCDTCDGVEGAVMFVGGPVWCMDWLPVEGADTEHYVALAAYRKLDETFQMRSSFTQPGLIQLWRLGIMANEQGQPPDPQFSLGVVHNYGVLRDMMWCPSVRYSSEREEGGRLGVLAVSCSDGTIRILVLPKPEELSQQLSRRKGKSSPDSGSLFVTVEREAATLVPSGIGTSDWSDFGQCLCLDWLPGCKYSRIAGGFSNGVVCVWDLETTRHVLPGLCSEEKGLVIHPIAQLTAHKAPCRTVTWCPHDHNYLFTGGYDKFASLWDLRQPFSPIEKQEKGLMVSSQWPLLWNEILHHCDVTYGTYATCPVSALSYLHPPSGNRPVKNLLSCRSPITSISYSVWSDRVAAGSFAGELCLCALSSQCHLSNVVSNEKPFRKGKKKELMWLSYPELLTPPTSPHSPTPTSTVTPTQSHKLVLTPCPSKEVLSEHTSLSPDASPLQATTKVAWSPNEPSHEWILFGSNSGLVQLLHIRAPPHKPTNFLSTQVYQSAVC